MVREKEHDIEEFRISLQLYCKLNIAFKHDSADFKLTDVAYCLKWMAPHSFRGEYDRKAWQEAPPLLPLSLQSWSTQAVMLGNLYIAV